jgi:hypothetical protein
MKSLFRLSRVQLPALSLPLAGAPLSDRLSSLALGFALVLSLVFAGLTAGRIHQVERTLEPAVDDARSLSAALEATRVLLRDGRLGSAESRIARADSQAQRFHMIATNRPAGALRAQMRAYDAAFGTYYVAARRAALGLSMSADADGSSAEDASLGFLMLRQNLAAGLEVQTAAIESTRPATAPVELAGWLALTLLSAAALLRRAFTTTATIEAVAVEEHHAPVASNDDPTTIRLQDALERLARKRLAASVAAAKVAKRNNERQIELARNWSAPMLSVVPIEQPMGEMDVYEDEQADLAPMFGQLRLVTA